MIGIKRRKKVEGWAQDVTDIDGGAGNQGLIQRIADSNKIWLCCFIVVIGLSIFFIRQANQSADLDKKSSLPIADWESYDPELYSEFAGKFVKDADYKDILVETPSFNGPDKFRILVPGDVSRDEIEYAARMAARMISHKFKHRVVVQVYMKRANGSSTLVATTSWSKDKGYTVKFKNEAEELL